MIFTSTYTVQRGKDAPIKIEGVVITYTGTTAEDMAHLMTYEFYLKRALKLIDKVKEWEKYRIVNIALGAEVKGINT